MLSPGSSFGHYQIIEFLGEGAVGVAYKALDQQLDRTVAIKLLKPELAKSTRFRDRLKKEAQSVAKVKSPHVVEIYEFSEFQGTHYLAMEYVPGIDLVAGAQDKELDVKLDLISQLAEGLQAAHDVGLVHRDIKPANVLLDDRGQVKIMDFGLATIESPSTIVGSGLVSGTLWYASPEQLCNEEVTSKSDLFSLGSVFYELITGRRPFEGGYSALVYYSILHEEPLLPSDIVPDIPDWLEHTVLRLLAKKPEDRPATARDMATQIRQFLSGAREPQVERVKLRRKHVTVVDLRNLSGDKSWDYFCQGFTEDVTSELGRRSNLAVSSLPSENAPRDIQSIFVRYRSDYVITGSLMQWQGRIQLKLTIFADGGTRVVSAAKYEQQFDQLFELLSRAAHETAELLASQSGEKAVDVNDYFKVDISAYEYYLRGKSYYHTSKPREQDFAIQMFEKALEIDPSFALAHAGLADVLAFKFGGYYDRRSEIIETAISHANTALSIEGSLPEAHRSLGRCHMFSGDTEKAETCFKKSVELNPKFALGYRTLAWLKYQTGRYREAMEWANRSLQLSPTDTETLLLMGILHTYERRYTAALATLQRAIEIEPDYGRAYYNLGLVYQKLGVLDLSIENFELACRYKGDPNCYVDAGWSLFLDGRYDEARSAYGKSIEGGWMTFIAHYNLGFLEWTLGRKELAQSCFETALKTLTDVDYSNPENIQIQGYYALVLAALGRSEEAREVTNEMLEQGRLIGDVLYNIGRAYAWLSDEPASIRYLKTALQTSPGPTESEVLKDPHFSGLDLSFARRDSVA